MRPRPDGTGRGRENADGQPMPVSMPASERAVERQCSVGSYWSSAVKHLRYTSVMMRPSANSVSAAMEASTMNWYFAASSGSPPAMI